MFIGVNYLLKKGTAMGTRAPPNFANVFMGYFENRFVYQSRWFNRFIKSWWRYIDDIFMLWKRPRKPLEDFLKYLNEVNPSIKFEWKISKHKVSFLDCDVMKENNKLKTDVYQKSTDCHPYLPGDPKRYSCLIKRKMHNKRETFKFKTVLGYQ